MRTSPPEVCKRGQKHPLSPHFSCSDRGKIFSFRLPPFYQAPDSISSGAELYLIRRWILSYQALNLIKSGSKYNTIQLQIL